MQKLALFDTPKIYEVIANAKQGDQNQLHRISTMIKNRMNDDRARPVYMHPVEGPDPIQDFLAASPRLSNIVGYGQIQSELGRRAYDLEIDAIDARQAKSKAEYAAAFKAIEDEARLHAENLKRLKLGLGLGAAGVGLAGGAAWLMARKKKEREGV